MARQLDGYGLDWQRIEAIDARTADDADIAEQFGIGPLSGKLPSTLADRCCSLSNKLAWEQVLQSGQKAALILEDDALLSDNLADLLKTDVAGMMRQHGLDALKLEYWPARPARRRRIYGQRLAAVRGLPDTTLYRLLSSGFGTCAYIITADAIRRMLRDFPDMQVPVDHYLFGQQAGMGFRALNSGFLNPAPVYHNVTEYGSDIAMERRQQKVSIGEQPIRSWLERRFFRLGHNLQRLTGATCVRMEFAGQPPETTAKPDMS